MVLYEICNPPASSKVTPEQQFSMLGYWGKNFSHELKRPMIECVKRIINKNYLTADEAITLMKTISSFPGLYNALGIVNNAVDDEFDKIEAVYESIVDKWRI